MTRRRSIDIEGFGHANPIPAASRVGDVVMSGVILGRDGAAGAPPPGLEAQCALVFRHMRAVVEAAGGTCADIVKVDVWLKDPTDRAALNAEWTRAFPDPASRPARHTQPLAGDGPYLIQCSFAAVLGAPVRDRR